MTEAKRAAAAENCAKLKKPELAAACNDRISGSDWLPPVLVTADVPEPQAAEREDGSFNDEEGIAEPMAIAAE